MHSVFSHAWNGVSAQESKIPRSFFAKRAEKQMHIAKTSAVQTVHRPPLLHY